MFRNEGSFEPLNKSKYVIVVGIDYSTSSERALDEALELARSKHGVQLHIANVRPTFAEQAESNGAPAPLPPWRYWATELRDYVARKVAAFQATAGVAPFQHVYTHQRMNDPALELAQLAADVEADLLVVGTHDWHGSSRLALGSTAEAVTRLASRRDRRRTERAYGANSIASTASAAIPPS
jgi:nucleotide-binding universal stress UspA family protein